MEWHQYMNWPGSYGYDSGMVLVAYADGAWVVWNAHGSKASADSKEPLSGSLDKAKQLAEDAAKTLRQ